MANNKIRIRLKSFDHKILDASAEKIISSAKKSGAQVVGPVPLPTEKEVYTILRAVHKYKDSREQFEIRTHKRLIDIVNPTPETVDVLTRLELPSGVDIEIKFIGLRPGEKLYEELLTDGEGTNTTTHKKIFEAALEDVDQEWLSREIERFDTCKTDIDVINVLQDIIPTYDPNHNV